MKANDIPQTAYEELENRKAHNTREQVLDTITPEAMIFHKNAIIAYLEGKQIEGLTIDGWKVCEFPDFSLKRQSYRETPFIIYTNDNGEVFTQAPETMNKNVFTATFRFNANENTITINVTSNKLSHYYGGEASNSLAKPHSRYCPTTRVFSGSSGIYETPIGALKHAELKLDKYFKGEDK